MLERAAGKARHTGILGDDLVGGQRHLDAHPVGLDQHVLHEGERGIDRRGPQHIEEERNLVLGHGLLVLRRHEPEGTEPLARLEDDMGGGQPVGIVRKLQRVVELAGGDSGVRTMPFQIAQPRPVLDQPGGDVGLDDDVGIRDLSRRRAQQALLGEADPDHGEDQRRRQPPALPGDENGRQRRDRQERQGDRQMRQVDDHGEGPERQGEQDLAPPHPAPEDRQGRYDDDQDRGEDVGHQEGDIEGQRSRGPGDERDRDERCRQMRRPVFPRDRPGRQPGRQEERERVDERQRR